MVKNNGTIEKQKITYQRYGERTPTDPSSFDGTWAPLEEHIEILSEYFKSVACIEKNSLSTIVDIGSLNGKWEDFLFRYTDKIICVDLFDDCFENIRRRYPNKNLDFYVTSGTELGGADEWSIDLIFSIDSLTRSNFFELVEYIKDFNRVLKKDGKIIINFGIDWSKRDCFRLQPYWFKSGFRLIDLRVRHPDVEFFPDTGPCTPMGWLALFERAKQ
jgi:SAM-dependent methyltransferase